MKMWEYAKVDGTSIKIDNWMSDTMGIVDGGCVYSTLFKHPEQGPKDYEIVISMFPQENYRTLVHITMYLKDIPGSSAQAAEFLASKGINILNSVSLNGISDTVIVWKLMADLNFAGEGDLLSDSFNSLKSQEDPSVSNILMIDIKPAEIGRLFKSSRKDDGKTELKRGYPATINGGCFDISETYGDILPDMNGQTVLMTMDADSWVMSLTFFKKDTKLVKTSISIPDCPGSITRALGIIAGWDINLISVFSKIKVCYQSMNLELFMDVGKIKVPCEELQAQLKKAFEGLKGEFDIVEFKEIA